MNSRSAISYRKQDPGGFQRVIIDGQWHHRARVSRLAGGSHDHATPLPSLPDAVHPLTVGVESTRQA
ncbi:hypothetical protein ACFRCW_19135 [Streptomyces sp. NPDC056653]|uniref:hypothetical protein n=1 Tax=Streptomyces sp. NPDC056653 TaxID=3345894 RepID=UPI00368EA020